MIRKQSLPINVSFLVIIFVSCFSCATSVKNLRRISLGVSKNDVIRELGEPMAARGAIRNKYDQVVEVWEYKLAMPRDDSAGEIVEKSILTVFTLGMSAGVFKGERKNYWLYFIDDELVQWGEAGDWTQEAERIYDIKFNQPPRISK